VREVLPLAVPPVTPIKSRPCFVFSSIRLKIFKSVIIKQDDYSRAMFHLRQGKLTY
jgi:hypothetical protein